MPYSNGKITAPVSIYDVRRALNASANDVGRLCAHQKINMWARYKPVIYRGFPVRFSGDTEFDKVTGLNVGAMIDSPSSVAGFSDIEITYAKPFGGMASPYRISDFVKYNHFAEKPVSITWSSNFRTDRAMVCTVSIYDRTSSADSSESISFSDVVNEISGYDGFKNKDKRLCLAVFMGDSDTPAWYFFSESFSNVGSSGTWSVSTKMSNPIFSDSHVGQTYKFVVMLVSDHDDLNDVVPDTDRYVWENGVSPEKMSEMESDSDPIMAMCLAFERDTDRTQAVLQDAHVVVNISYFLDVMSVEKFGNIVQSGVFNILCTKIWLPTITVSSPNQMNESACYQMRVRFSQGNTQFGIFRPIDGDGGGNYYEADFSNALTSLPEMPITRWIRISDLSPDYRFVYPDKYEYEFTMYDYQYIMLSLTAEQTRNESSGLFLFFDQDTSAGDEFNVVFSLYFKEYQSAASETKVRDFSVTYNVNDGEGMIHDIEIL